MDRIQTKFRLLIMVFFTMWPLGGLFAGNGGERGGGNAYFGIAKEAPVFLDLRIYDPTFVESRTSYQTPLENSVFLQKVGYERLFPSLLPVYWLALYPKLEKVSAAAPHLVATIRNILEGGVNMEGFGILYVRERDVQLTFENCWVAKTFFT